MKSLLGTKIINLSQNENLHGFPEKILLKAHKILDKTGLTTYRKEGKLRIKLAKKHANVDSNNRHYRPCNN